MSAGLSPSANDGINDVARQPSPYGAYGKGVVRAHGNLALRAMVHPLPRERAGATHLEDARVRD